MKTTTLYNLSGSDAMISIEGVIDGIMPSGGVYYVPQGAEVTAAGIPVEGGENAIAVITPSGDLQFSGVFPPSDGENFTTGFEIGLPIATAILLIRIVKLIRGGVSNV